MFMFTLSRFLARHDVWFNVSLSELWRENMNNPNFEDDRPGRAWTSILKKRLKKSNHFSAFDDDAGVQINSTVTTFESYIHKVIHYRLLNRKANAKHLVGTKVLVDCKTSDLMNYQIIWFIFRLNSEDFSKFFSV